MAIFFLAISLQIVFCDCYAIIFLFFVDLQNPHFLSSFTHLCTSSTLQNVHAYNFFHISPTIQGIVLNKSLSMACGALKT
jgi:hypothetical protein